MMALAGCGESESTQRLHQQLSLVTKQLETTNADLQSALKRVETIESEWKKQNETLTTLWKTDTEKLSEAWRKFEASYTPELQAQLQQNIAFAEKVKAEITTLADQLKVGAAETKSRSDKTVAELQGIQSAAEKLRDLCQAHAQQAKDADLVGKLEKDVQGIRSSVSGMSSSISSVNSKISTLESDVGRAKSDASSAMSDARSALSEARSAMSTARSASQRSGS